jgi:hypothetical protein
MSEKIVEYLKKNISKGYTIDSLKIALLRQGYSRAMVELSISKVHTELAKQAPILKDKPTIKYEFVDELDNPVEMRKPWWKRLFFD